LLIKRGYMARVRENIKIANKNYWALFDGGARNTYVTNNVANLLSKFKLSMSEPVALGDKMHKIKEGCTLTCKIQGLPIWTHARIIEKIEKDEEEKEIQVLIGALTMQEWGIKLDLEREKLDMTNYPKEFVEF
jgi:hypothetical protein